MSSGGPGETGGADESERPGAGAAAREQRGRQESGWGTHMHAAAQAPRSRRPPAAHAARTHLTSTFLLRASEREAEKEELREGRSASRGAGAGAPPGGLGTALCWQLRAAGGTPTPHAEVPRGVPGAARKGHSRVVDNLEPLPFLEGQIGLCPGLVVIEGHEGGHSACGERWGVRGAEERRGVVPCHPPAPHREGHVHSGVCARLTVPAGVCLARTTRRL